MAVDAGQGMVRRIRDFARQFADPAAQGRWRRYLVLFAAALFAWALLVWLEAFAPIHAYADADWRSGIDALFITLLVICVAALGVMAMRSRDFAAEAGQRALAEAQLATALNTMHHGISMFDAEQRLILANGRFRELYRLPPDLMRPGTPLIDILEFRGRDSRPGQPSALQYREMLVADLARGGTHSKIHEYNDGRAVYIVYEPREGGGWVSTHEDITERRRMEERVSRLAHYDALTDLANRVLFRQRLGTALCDVKRGETLAVLCLDLDHFKATNETLGHPVGDGLLCAVADRLSGSARETDLIARMGGDEFAILQRVAEQPMAATTLAERVIALLSEAYHVEGHVIVTGTSIGIAVAPTDGIDADQLLKRAEQALYLAKSDGRGVYRFFEPEMDRRMHARRQLELDLRAALPARQFELYYQPVLDLSTNQVKGLEGLIRWNHPTRGRVVPNDFIPLAEETGLIVPIGEWVLRQACAEAVRWPDHVVMAVNVSPVQFKSHSLVQTVFSALSTSGLAPSRLELEITESLLLQDTESTLATINQLRALGVRIVMDDFGTGYSSLSYFQRFPFDKVKIDRSFIQGLSNGKSALAILRAVASLAESLSITTTVEGVETEEQLARVRHEGIHQVQGYLVSPPRPAGELDEMMADVSGASRLAG